MTLHWLRSSGTSSRTTSKSEPSASPLATAGQRAAAYLFDALVLGPPMVAALSQFDSHRGRLGRNGLVVLLVANLYHIAFEGTTGWTPGKRAVGIQVVRSDGGPCTYRAATIRTLARFVDFLPFGYLAAFGSMALTERRQRLGDLLARTVVFDSGDRT